MSRNAIIGTVSVLIILILLLFVFDIGRKGGTNSTATTTATSTNFSNEIVVFTPTENQQVKSPIKITGKAVGNWFFEASFPIELADIDGNIIATTHATADGDWMTTDFVNFTAEITYNNASTTGPALLVLKNDNPSGDPARDKEIFIPVVLK